MQDVVGSRLRFFYKIIWQILYILQNSLRENSNVFYRSDFCIVVMAGVSNWNGNHNHAWKIGRFFLPNVILQKKEQ